LKQGGVALRKISSQDDGARRNPGTRTPAPAGSTSFGQRRTLSLQHDIESLQKHFSWAFVSRFRIFMITNRKKKIYQSVRFDFILGVMHLGCAVAFCKILLMRTMQRPVGIAVFGNF
jgi:hypothetical protein